MPLLELRGVSKFFPGVQVLRSIDLDVEAGEVHAIIGENGAGKSTLIKLLSGVYERDDGVIRFDQSPVSFGSPQESQRAGIRTLYQEFNLLPGLTVAENIFLGSEPQHGWLPFIHWGRLQQQARALLDLLELDIQPGTQVSKLSVAEQQMIELAKMLHTQARLLIMDEPTASLSGPEVDTLFRLIRRIKARGVGVIYISHRLDEVLAIADRATILRDGRRVATVNTADASVDLLAQLMSGSMQTYRKPRAKPTTGREVLRVDRLTRAPVFHDISFRLHAGEIVGLTGLAGSGRSALVRTLFGFDLPDSGQVAVDGRTVEIHSPQDAVALGIGMLPEERQRDGLMLDLSARENISLVALEKYGMLVDTDDEADLVSQYIDRLHIKLSSPEAKAVTLSGGTQQKLILSRWMAANPHILVFDEPTRGIDLKSKAEIYGLIAHLASKGTAVLLVSSELAEIAQVCHRAMVMRAGEMIATLQGDDVTEANLNRYVTGGVP